MALDTTMKIAVILSAYDRMSSVINSSVSNAQKKLASFSAKTNQLAEKSFQTGRQLVTAGLAIGAPIYKAVDAAKEFETKMIDIRKQMNVDSPETVKAMTGDIFRLSKTLPIATGQIQDMVAAGLRMGIAQDKIIDYTKQVTKMSVAFDMPAAEIADSMGKVANVFKIPIDKVGEFADAINYLDDNTIAKGPELINVLQRIGGSARNLSPNTAAALASTLLSAGESAENAGTGINAMLNRLGAATMQAKKFQDGMELLGLSSQRIQKQMSDKSTAKSAILEVFDKISQLRPEKQTEALVRLFGNEQGPKLTKLALNVGELRREMEMVNGQQKGSMDKEYQKRLASSSAQMQIFRNKISEVAVRVGTVLLPSLNKLMTSIGGIMEKVSRFVEIHPTLVSGLVKAAAVASALALAGGYLSLVFGGIFKLFSIGSRVISFLVSAFNVLKTTFMVLRVVVMAFPIVGWIMAIATAVFFIIKYWTPISKFFVMVWQKVKLAFSAAWQWIKKMFLNYTPYGLIIKHWSKITGFFSGMWGKVRNIFNGAVNWVMGLGKTFYNAGVNIINSLWKGIKSMAHKPIEAMHKVVSKIRKMLPFSPAKEGPLRDINKIRLVETIAENIRPASMINAMRNTAFGVMNFLRNPGTGMPQLAASGVHAGGGFTMNVTVHLSGSATAADGKAVSDAVKKEFPKWIREYERQKGRISFI
ncbi:phage tail tape measure protein [Arachidicoccus terrestris]|uniref:phage tail tape measure protein n=1 Tax=Arachidicoccus terrestris TaxID=2875539 RepID=UPI001CC78EDA|nr:phage tail tape measure protein [Arachidicoccus terrestris]UAY56266.1 phage tail tape measure protein [Arachidicoccus terrestris]